MKNYWKYIIISMLAGIAVFHISAMVYIWDENYELTSPDYYAEEGTYMDLMAMIKDGAMYRWQLNLTRDDIQLKVTDAAGATLELNTVTLTLYKPDKAGLDKTLILTPNGQGGWYVAKADLATGRWRATVTASHDQTRLAYRANTAVR